MSPQPLRARWLQGVAVVVLAVVVFALLGYALYSRGEQTASAERGAAAYTPPPPVLPTPAYGDIVRPIDPLPRGSRAYFFGDSYVDGYGASDPATRGFVPLVAEQFGWRYRKNAAGGTGFVNPGPSGQTYLQRLSKVKPFDADVIVLSGGLNDETRDPAVVVAAAEKVVDRLRALSPDAQIIMMGPVDPYTVEEQTLAVVDRALRQFAADEHLPYIDAYLYSLARYTQNDKRHPNDAGYALIARRVEAFIRKCTAS